MPINIFDFQYYLLLYISYGQFFRYKVTLLIKKEREPESKIQVYGKNFSEGL